MSDRHDVLDGAISIGDAVRYKPGGGTYGYEDLLEADGRIPAEVIGFSRTRVRLRFKAGRVRDTTRCVDAASLVPA